LQLECIGCGLCIDACNEIMDKVGRPQGLIAFESYANRIAARRSEPPHRRFWRPRTILYGAVLAVIAGLMTAALATRGTLEMSLLPDRNPLFVRLSDGSIRDGFTIKIENKSGETRLYTVTARGLSGALLHVAEAEQPPVSTSEGITLAVRGDRIGTYRLYIQAPMSGEKEVPIVVTVRDGASGETARHGASFRGPGHP
jgi:polyferredoxin